MLVLLTLFQILSSMNGLNPFQRVSAKMWTQKPSTFADLREKFPRAEAFTHALCPPKAVDGMMDRILFQTDDTLDEYAYYHSIQTRCLYLLENHVFGWEACHAECQASAVSTVALDHHFYGADVLLCYSQPPHPVTKFSCFPQNVAYSFYHLGLRYEFAFPYPLCLRKVGSGVQVIFRSIYSADEQIRKLAKTIKKQHCLPVPPLDPQIVYDTVQDFIAHGPIYIRPRQYYTSALDSNWRNLNYHCPTFVVFSAPFVLQVQHPPAVIIFIMIYNGSHINYSNETSAGSLALGNTGSLSLVIESNLIQAYTPSLMTFWDRPVTNLQVAALENEVFLTERFMGAHGTTYNYTPHTLNFTDGYYHAWDHSGEVVLDGECHTIRDEIRTVSIGSIAKSYWSIILKDIEGVFVSIFRLILEVVGEVLLDLLRDLLAIFFSTPLPQSLLTHLIVYSVIRNHYISLNFSVLVFGISYVKYS